MAFALKFIRRPTLCPDSFKLGKVLKPAERLPEHSSNTRFDYDSSDWPCFQIAG